MAIREHWNRLLRKPEISTSSSFSSSSDTSSPPTSPGYIQSGNIMYPQPRAVTKRGGSTASRHLERITSWRSNTSATTASTSSSSRSSTWSTATTKRSGLRALRLHPSDRPLTEQNLRHQEMLGRFTMKYAQRRRPSYGDMEQSLTEISPCNSRNGSVDSGHGPTASLVGNMRDGRRAIRSPVPLYQATISEESLWWKISGRDEDGWPRIMRCYSIILDACWRRTRRISPLWLFFWPCDGRTYKAEKSQQLLFYFIFITKKKPIHSLVDTFITIFNQL